MKNLIEKLTLIIQGIKKRFNSIRSQIALSYLVSILVIIFTLNLTALAIFSNWEYRRARSSIIGIKQELYNNLSVINYLNDASTKKVIEKEIFSFNLTKYNLSALTVKARYKETEFSTRLNIEHEFPFDKNVGGFHLTRLNGDLILIHNSILNFDSKLVRVQMLSNFSEITKDFNSLFFALIMATLIVTVISIYSSKNIAKTMLVPINKISSTVREIDKNDLNKRVEIVNPDDELGELSQVINSMIRRLEISFKTQDKFISNASHELRTPLAVIKGYADLLNSGAKSDKEMLDKGLEEISKEVHYMENLIKKLLFLARKESSMITSNLEKKDISIILRNIIEKQILVDPSHNYSIISNEESVLYIDEGLVAQVIRELLKNASKYTPEGKNIRIGSYISENHHIIQIIDEGIGISDEMKDNIFERFFIANESRNRQLTSFGLGLSIVKEIVNLHDGEISVSSEVDKGTTFTLKFPI